MAKAPPIRNVPPPPGGKTASAYTRFIPREELQGFEAWSPDALHGQPGSTTSGAPAAPAAPADDAQVKARVAAARKAGYQDGYRDGLVALEGFKQSFAAQMSGQIGKLITALDDQFDALEADMAQALTRSALALARQIVRSEIAQRPELVAQVAGEAVQAVLLSARHIAVRVHPQDVALVVDGAAEALETRGARVVADPAIDRGGCLVETDLGAVEATLPARWAQAAANLGLSTDGSPDDEPA